MITRDGSRPDDAATASARGEHLKLYRFSTEDYHELKAVFNGRHPQTGEDLEVVQGPPEGAPPNDLPPQPAVFAPDHAPEEIKETAAKLREMAGVPKKPSGEVAEPQSTLGKVVSKVTP